MIFPNWLDIILVLFLARQIYLARGSSIIAEGLRLLGVVLATFFALHYYSPLGAFFKKYLIVFDKVYNLAALGIIAGMILSFFEAINKGWIMILKIKVHPLFDQNIGFFFGVVKSLLLTGLLFYTLCISGIGFFEQGSRGGVLRVLFGNLSTTVYEAIYLDVVKPFFPEEKINEDIFIFSIEDLKLTDAP